MMGSILRVVLLISVLAFSAACATTKPTPAPPPPIAQKAAEPVPPAPPSPPPPKVRTPPFESSDFVVTFAKAGDTAESLAARHLGDAGKAWMIRDYAGIRTIHEGDEVVIPKREWNPTGVYSRGYQLVPVLVYHNLNPQPKRPLTMAPAVFEEQMRYLKAEGFQVITLRDFLDFTSGQRQLPSKSVLLTFDDGYAAFLKYAYPVLKELGFRATLFVYTDFIGAGGNALTWQNLKDLADEGFDVQAHSKSHADLRRHANEASAVYSKRLEAELTVPLAAFQKHLGRGSETLAYPFGAADDEVRRYTARVGYTASFTVQGPANPSFATPFAISRVQVFSDVSITDFARILNTFQDNGAKAPARDRMPANVSDLSTPEALAAVHHRRGNELEQQELLRQALDEQLIALTISPESEPARVAAQRLADKIQRKVAELTDQAGQIDQRSPEWRDRNLAILALDPKNRPAFDALKVVARVGPDRGRQRDTNAITHTVRAGETLTSLATLYYGDPSRADVIAGANQITADAALARGRKLQIPEIPGVPFLPH